MDVDAKAPEPALTRGTITRAEGGTGVITRYADGRATRYKFTHRFKTAPHVQVTPDLGSDPSTRFKQFWLYFLSNGGPVVDVEGFSLGVYADVGYSVPFRWTAIEIQDRSWRPRWVVGQETYVVVFVLMGAMAFARWI
ncbi:uncharacterized protein BDV14DRAFT_202553 [Aspergillus stella-maris]|uniref:uncharacterized protein n=1 Tax=Aspergillus stella-maris TaxID=1810926 RepID=UPI003CCE4221